MEHIKQQSINQQLQKNPLCHHHLTQKAKDACRVLEVEENAYVAVLSQGKDSHSIWGNFHYSVFT
jgi:hypothetical protein